MKVNNNVKVLLASYNGEQWIAEQIKTILEQDNVNIYLYVSDDFSTDGTITILGEVSSRNSNVTLLTPNKAGSAGANFLRLIRDVRFDANCDYVAFSDQDDIWINNKLETAISHLSAENVDAYSSNVLAFWSNGTKKVINKAQNQREFDYMFESAGPGCTFVITKKLALDLQSFITKNQKRCEDIALHDWFIYAFARSRGYKWFIDKEPHVLYRQHEGNVVGANIGIKAKIDRWRKMQQGWHKNQSLIIASALNYDCEFPIDALNRYRYCDRLKLIVNFRKLRRRLCDSIAFAIFLIFSK